MIEIERKFLVKGEFKIYATKSKHFKQAYITSASDITIRLRLAENTGYLTFKGKSDKKGISRIEWEKELSLTEAEELFSLCNSGIIEKIRYFVPYGGHTFEVDEFLGENSGLVMAEIELNDENEHFEKPDWLGEEVTGDKKYYNSFLAVSPYSKW